MYIYTSICCSSSGKKTVTVRRIIVRETGVSVGSFEDPSVLKLLGTMVPRGFPSSILSPLRRETWASMKLFCLLLFCYFFLVVEKKSCRVSAGQWRAPDCGIMLSNPATNPVTPDRNKYPARNRYNACWDVAINVHQVWRLEIPIYLLRVFNAYK